MDKNSRVIKGFFSQQGYANLVGLNKSTISQYVAAGKLDVYFTEDGKALIKANPKIVEEYRNKNKVG